MKIYAIKCLKCGDIIYSRARHDCHFCSCGNLGIDGGKEYQKISFNPEIKYEQIEIELDITEKELYDDWNKRKDLYGLIKCDNNG